MKVNIFVAFLFAMFAIGVAVDDETHQKFREECAKEYSISKEAIDMWNDGKLPQNIPKFKDMLLCYFKKLKLMNDAGVVDIDELKKGIKEHLGSEEGANKFIELCIQNNVGGAQGAWDLEECYLKNRAGLMTV